MDIKNRIQNINEYFKSINVHAEDNIIYVLVQFPRGWDCSELTEPNFNVKCARESDELIYFFAQIEVGLDTIFDAIEYNINFNKEAQIKVDLLKEKIEMLKCIFEKEDIKTLETLEFKYKTTSKRSKKKTNNKNINDNELEINSDNNSDMDNDSLDNNILNKK